MAEDGAFDELFFIFARKEADISTYSLDIPLGAKTGLAGTQKAISTPAIVG